MPNKGHSRLEIALRHANRGWRVFPLHTPNAEGTCSCGKNDDPEGERHPVGKHPRIGEWQKSATTDTATIQAWWKKWPDANIGIATGPESGLIVLDIDGPEGESIVERFGVPKTPTVVTGKGRQLYFKHPGFKAKNVVKVYPELDGRGDGGYVCAPGCLHASGKLYYFEEGLSPEAVTLADAPSWWLDVIRDSGMADKEPRRSKGPITAGSRNSYLASQAGSLRDRGLDAEPLEFALLNLNQKHCQPPLSDSEVKTIAASYSKYEEGDPGHGIKLFELAKKLMRTEHFVCSPIDEEGKGVVLMVYRDGSFKPHGASVARRMALHGLGNAAREDTISGAVALIKEATKKDDTLLNPKATQYINVANGMLDWATGELVPHDPTYLSSIQLPVEWRPEASSELLDRFLSEVFPPDALPLADEIVGYSMMPTTRFQKAFMLCGSGANGKSTLLHMLRGFLGEVNISGVSLHALEDSLFAAAELQGKLLNIYADLAATKLEKVEAFKQLVSGDPFSAQRKYGQPYILNNFARLMFSANAFPRADDASEAFMRRWIVIPFPNSFEGKACDPYLPDKLRHPDVLSALLVKAVHGLRRLMHNNGFSRCPSVEAKVEEYRVENDSCYEFARDTLKSAPGQRIPKKEVWAKYETWCTDNGIKFPMAPRKFNHLLADHMKCALIKSISGGVATNVWDGIQWDGVAEEEVPF